MEFIDDFSKIYQRTYHRMLVSMYSNGIKPEKDFVVETLRQRLQKLIYVLKRDDLIKRVQRKRKGIFHWQLTEKGKTKLKSFHGKFFTPEGKLYVPESAQETTIIIFDIPERYRLLRRWLRINLGILDFDKLQKSVYIGKVKLPKDFLQWLVVLHIDRYIHIFQVTKFGTLLRGVGFLPAGRQASTDF